MLSLSNRIQFIYVGVSTSSSTPDMRRAVGWSCYIMQLDFTHSQVEMLTFRGLHHCGYIGPLDLKEQWGLVSKLSDKSSLQTKL